MMLEGYQREGRGRGFVIVCEGLTVSGDGWVFGALGFRVWGLGLRV